jgi:hypothetical protein
MHSVNIQQVDSEPNKFLSSESSYTADILQAASYTSSANSCYMLSPRVKSTKEIRYGQVRQYTYLMKRTQFPALSQWIPTTCFAKLLCTSRLPRGTKLLSHGGYSWHFIAGDCTKIYHHIKRPKKKWRFTGKPTYIHETGRYGGGTQQPLVTYKTRAGKKKTSHLNISPFTRHVQALFVICTENTIPRRLRHKYVHTLYPSSPDKSQK